MAMSLGDAILDPVESHVDGFWTASAGWCRWRNQRQWLSTIMAWAVGTQFDQVV
jgi:hypothetical protein